MTPQLATDKKRLAIMAVTNVLAVIVAIAAIVIYFKFALGWALALFVVAMLTGFGAQIWFIAGLRAKKGV